MKVLICHNRYRSTVPSGEDRGVDDEIWLLRSAGVDVIPVIEESDSLARGSRLKMANAALGPVYSPMGVRRFRRLLREERPDVVHLHNVFPLISPAVVRIAKSAGVPVVQTVRNFRHTCINGRHFRDGHTCDDCVGHMLGYPGVLHKCYRGSRAESVAMVIGQTVHRRTWLLADKFIARTPFMAERLLLAGIGREKITVVPQWVPDPGKSTIPGRDFLYLGRLDEAKGIDLVVEAWRARRQLNGRRLCIAGAGPGEKWVRMVASGARDVEYLGLLDRAGSARAIERSGIVIVPSLWYEAACPRTAAESLAHGRPVMVNAGTGVDSLVTDEFAWSVTGTVACWSEALSAVEQEEVEARGLAGRRHYLAKYSPARALDSLLRVYSEVTSGAR